METRRHYYRCTDCLSVCVVRHDGWSGKRLDCDACNGALEHMGYVRGEACLEKRHLLCPCNGACTGALGPNCECQCGGENHGRGLECFITECQHQGGVPRVKPRDDVSARIRAAEYREARSAIMARVPSLYDEDGRRVYLSGELFNKRCGALGLVVKADKARSHKGRMGKLREAAEIVGAVVTTKAERLALFA